MSVLISICLQLFLQEEQRFVIVIMDVELLWKKAECDDHYICEQVL